MADPGGQSGQEATRQSQPMKAMTFMALAVACFALLDATTKWLTAGYGTWQLLGLTRIMPLLVALIIAARMPQGLLSLRTPFIRWHLLRAALMICTTWCFYEALRTVRLADAVAIAFAAPLFITILSGPLLGEKIGLRRWLAVLAGFGGVMVAINPLAGDPGTGVFLVLIAALTYALLLMALRPLAGRESSHNILFYVTFFCAIVAVPMMMQDWRTPTLFDATLILCQSSLGTVAQLAMICAFRLGEASMLAPIEYTGFIWAVILGFILWGELPTSATIAGALLIVGATIYISHRENRAARQGAR